MHTRSLIVCVLSVTTALAVSSCGNDDGTRGDSGSAAGEKTEQQRSRTPSPSPSPSSPEPLDPPDPRKPPEPDPTEPAPPSPGPAADLIGIDWVRPSGGDTQDKLVVHYQLPTPCSPGLRRAVVDETASDVTISLLREPEPTRDDSMKCAQVIVDESTTVTLDRPLGDRTVIDASSDEQVRIGE